MREDDDDERPRRHRREERTPRKGVSPWVWVAVALGGLGLLSCCGVGGLFFSGVFQGVKNARTKYTPMTADQLIDEWQQNPAAAAAKYKTNGVELNGRLHKIDSNIHGQTYIDVRGNGDDWKRSTHIFVLDGRAKDGLAKCAVGKKVVVKAHTDGTTQDRPWLIADEIASAD